MFSEIAMEVMKDRYLHKNPKTGELLEDPDGMFQRVAKAMGDPKFYTLLSNLDFLPNTPTLVNAGRENGQLSACFVLPIEDSMDGIYTTLHDAAMIHKTGGGTGFSFSRLRHKGAPVYSTAGTSSGVIPFLRVYNESTNSVKQGGVRRGANMGILNVDHPDIEEFIMCKDDPNEITNFNLSVGITEGFMHAVEHNADWPLIDPAHHNVVKTVKAGYLWDMIVHQAWKNGEPGVIFLDTVNKQNPCPEFGKIEATNPCGEQPLLPYESCNLGSINLVNHVKDGRVDYGHLKNTIRESVDFLNAVLEHNCFPLPQIRQATLRTRKIGLGVMGWADMLLLLKLRYDSPEARALAHEVMGFIQETAWAYNREKGYDNAAMTTVAPTGTISMIAGVSSGIEPNFSWVYRRVSMDREFYVVHPIMEAELVRRNMRTDDVLDALYRGKSLKEIPGLEDLCDYWQCSQEIAPEDHIRMQSCFQDHVDSAVSKTINLPNDATEADVAHAYLLAYQLGCKGVTVYRDGCRESQVLNFAKDEKSAEDSEKGCCCGGCKKNVRERPIETTGTTRKTQIGCGSLYVTVNSDDTGKPIEVFTNTGKAGGCPAQSEGLARLLSLCLRYEIPMDDIIRQLKGIRCMSTIRKDGCDVLSCPDAIARTLANTGKMQGAPVPQPVQETPVCFTTQTCPECGEPLETAEGCVICHSCGYSKCG